jgi:hypothetical protein
VINLRPKDNKNFSLNFLIIGFVLTMVSIIGILSIYLFLKVPEFIIFLIIVYPSFFSFVIGIIFILAGCNRTKVSKRKFYVVGIIIIGAFFSTIGIDLLISFLMSIF